MAYYLVVHTGPEDDPEKLTVEIDQMKWNITGLRETYRKGEELSEIRGYWMHETGKQKIARCKRLGVPGDGGMGVGGGGGGGGRQK